MLKISEQTLSALRGSQQQELARRFTGSFPQFGDVAIMHRYMVDADRAGIDLERDVAEFIMLLGRFGPSRPAHIQAIVDDPAISPMVKLFQLHYVQYGERMNGDHGVSEDNTATVPPPLQSFSPTQPVSNVVAQCLYHQPVKATRPPTTQRPKMPCDVKQLMIRIAENDGGYDQGSSGSFTVDSGPASRGVPSMRPLDVGVPVNAPANIRQHLDDYDLVMEVLALEPGRQLNTPMNNRPRTLNEDQQKRAVNDRGHSMVQAKTTASITASWDSHCGDPAHSKPTLALDIDDAKLMPASFQTEIVSKPITAFFRIPGPLTKLFDFDCFGMQHRITAGSCGVMPPGKVPTGALSALIIGYPVGATGVKMTYAPRFFSVGWGKWAKGKYSGELDAKAAATKDELGPLNAGSVALWQEAANASGKWAKKLRRAARKIDKRIAPLAARLANVSREDERGFHWGLVLFDREFSESDLKALPGGLRFLEAIVEVEKMVGNAEGIVANIRQLLTFIGQYNPSSIEPFATLDMRLCDFEFFAGWKAVGCDYIAGERYRALEYCFDAELDFTAFDITGSIGVTVGKEVLGTGATIEVMVSVGGGARVEAEYSHTGIGFKPLTTSVKFKGQVRASVHVIGEVKAAWFHLMKFTGSGSKAARIVSTTTFGDFFSKNWKIMLVKDPMVVTAEATLCLAHWHKEVTIWGGGETQLYP
jgi:hypothetical protein